MVYMYYRAAILVEYLEKFLECDKFQVLKLLPTSKTNDSRETGCTVSKVALSVWDERHHTPIHFSLLYQSYLPSLSNAHAVFSKPLVPVHHMEAHALTARLSSHVPFPYLVLLVSGGHCLLLVAEGVGSFQRLGYSTDDSPGELYDLLEFSHNNIISYYCCITGLHITRLLNVCIKVHLHCSESGFNRVNWILCSVQTGD